MFSKILIANRGEIAVRIIRTARRMGIRTVAVYSDADRDALHAQQADEAVRIGPAASAESYLKGEAVIDAARRTGAEAIHPGYGFLSENPDFVDAVERAGLTFIGPSSSAIRAMGLKDAAKQLMEKAKVPIVPGYHGEAQELVVLSGKANEIGFPVLIKARAGGGGKGMRRVDQQSDFGDALSSAKREARASFGDERVLVEKYVSSPRHIEVQIFGDSHGNAVHLFERDCSLQRRHQKVVEEAPAPGMTPEMRAAMGEAAVKAAKAIGYCGAGTVEFIVDASEGLREDRFYFMEMNTRLQVEHPVTEMITGLDLVEWQLRVAAGEPLPLRQEQLAIDGWAFEARLYAEDASRGFLPATGRIDHLRFPGTPVRVDSGVRAGDTVTPFYDPMIAKIITHGASRAEAHARMRAALTATQVAGTTTNIDFLKRLFLHDGFAAGDVDTGLIDRDIETLLTTSPMRAEAVALAALEASGMLAPEGRKPADPFDRLGPWCHWGAPERHISLTIGAGVVTLTLTRIGDATWTVSGWGDDALTLSAHRLDDRRVGFDIDGLRAQAQVVAHCVGQDPQSHKTGVTVFLDEVAYVFGIPPADLGDADNIASGDAVVAPMPGIVKQVLAATGQPVRRGEGLVIMEAMKMELTLAAPRDGSVAEVLVEAGAQVGEGAILIRLEQEIEQ